MVSSIPGWKAADFDRKPAALALNLHPLSRPEQRPNPLKPYELNGFASFREVGSIGERCEALWFQAFLKHA